MDYPRPAGPTERDPAASAHDGHRQAAPPLERRSGDGARWQGRAEQNRVEQAAGPARQRPDPLTPVGGDLWWDPKSDAMVWSREVLGLHGYHSRPADTGLRLLLDHVVPEDRERVASAFAQQRGPGTGSLRSVHHLVSHDRVGRSVLLVVSRADAAGPSHRHGFLVDLGPQLAEAADAAVVAARAGIGAVQRAAGVLSVHLDLDEDAAAALLRRLSSERNVKMRDLATRLVDAARRRERSTPRSRSWSVAQLLDEPDPHPGGDATP